MRALPGATLCLPHLQRINKAEAEATSFLPGCRESTEPAFRRAGLSQAHSGHPALLIQGRWDSFCRRGNKGSGGEMQWFVFLQTSPTAPPSRTSSLAQGRSAPLPESALSLAPPPGGKEAGVKGGHVRLPAVQRGEAGKRARACAGSLPAQPRSPREHVGWGASGPAGFGHLPEGPTLSLALGTAEMRRHRVHGP